MEYLKKLVEIPSYESTDEILEYIKNEMNERVEEIKIVEENGIKALLVGINTKLYDISPLILMGHIDTVKANIELYDTNPFALTEKDGKLFGLGTIDMKSFTAIVLENLDKLKKIKVPLVFCLSTDEETLNHSMRAAILWLKKLKITPKFTIVGEPTNQNFSLYSKADYEYKIEFFGKSSHSSKPSMGINAICASAKLVTFIENQSKKYKITSNPGIIKGGGVINIVPDYAELSFDIRSIYSNEINSFINDIKNEIKKLEKEYNGLKCNLENILVLPAFNNEDEKIKKIAKTLGLNFYDFTGGTEAGFFTEYSGQAVIFGVGDLKLAHKPNEYVVKNEYYAYSNKLFLLIEEIIKAYFN
jgi:acetylornithine deacetylase